MEREWINRRVPGCLALADLIRYIFITSMTVITAAVRGRPLILLRPSRGNGGQGLVVVIPPGVLLLVPWPPSSPPPSLFYPSSRSGLAEDGGAELM